MQYLQFVFSFYSVRITARYRRDLPLHLPLHVAYLSDVWGCLCIALYLRSSHCRHPLSPQLTGLSSAWSSPPCLSLCTSTSLPDQSRVPPRPSTTTPVSSTGPPPATASPSPCPALMGYEFLPVNC